MYLTLTVATRSVTSPLPGHVLDYRVRAREDQQLVAVLEPHQVRRFAPVPMHFDDFAVFVRVADVLAVNADTVTDGRFHGSPPALRCPCLAPASHATPGLASANTPLTHADGRLQDGAGGQQPVLAVRRPDELHARGERPAGDGDRQRERG